MGRGFETGFVVIVEFDTIGLEGTFGWLVIGVGADMDIIWIQLCDCMGLVVGAVALRGGRALVVVG